MADPIEYYKYKSKKHNYRNSDKSVKVEDGITQKTDSQGNTYYRYDDGDYSLTEDQMDFANFMKNSTDGNFISGFRTISNDAQSRYDYIDKVNIDGGGNQLSEYARVYDKSGRENSIKLLMAKLGKNSGGITQANIDKVKSQIASGINGKSKWDAASKTAEINRLNGIIDNDYSVGTSYSDEQAQTIRDDAMTSFTSESTSNKEAGTGHAGSDAFDLRKSDISYSDAKKLFKKVKSESGGYHVEGVNKAMTSFNEVNTAMETHSADDVNFLRAFDYKTATPADKEKAQTLLGTNSDGNFGTGSQRNLYIYNKRLSENDDLAPVVFDNLSNAKKSAFLKEKGYDVGALSGKDSDYGTMSQAATGAYLQGISPEEYAAAKNDTPVSSPDPQGQSELQPGVVDFISAQRSTQDNGPTEEFAQGGEIRQGAQSPVASQPIANSGATKAQKILKDFEGLNSTIDKETRDELLKRIYDEQEAKKQSKQQGQQFAAGGKLSDVTFGGAGGYAAGAGALAGMISDGVGAVQDFKGKPGDGDAARAIGIGLNTAGTAIGGATGDEDSVGFGDVGGNRWSDKDESSSGGSVYKEGPATVNYNTKSYAEGGNMGIALKAGAGLAQGFNDLGAVGKQYSAQQVGPTAGYNKLDIEGIKNSINDRTGSTMYRAESGATNWQDMLSVQTAVNADAGRQLNDVAIQKQQYDNTGLGDYNARKRADLIQQNVYNESAMLKTDKAGALADEQNRGAINHMLAVRAGVGQDYINKGLAEDIGSAVTDEEKAKALAALYGKAEGGQISGDSDVIQGMKEKGYSDQLINRILNQ